MGFFDIFKKKENVNNEKKLVTDNLADLLEKASANSAFRPKFYKSLLSDELIVLTNETNGETGEKILTEDTTFKLKTFEDGTIPVFSSTDRIFDNKVIEKEVSFIGMNGRSLFETTKGATLILNPFSNSKKELLPSEIESLLSGNLFEAELAPTTKGSKIRIGQPANLSEELINSIKDYCKRRPEVKSAFVAMIHRVEIDEFPNLLVALDVDSNEEDIFGEIGIVVKPYLKEKEHIDFMPLNGNSLSSYFEKIEPFYIRK